MPYKATSPHRPWTSKPQQYNKMPGQGRFHISKFYKTREWKMARLAHLVENPICVECAKEGSPKVGNTVDHKKPVNPVDPYNTHGGKYGEPLESDNLQTMCEHHHAIKSGNERWKK
jgi:5-methylcytosine-specific restriction protein A